MHDVHRVDEMLVQVVDVLAHAVVERGAHGDVIEDRQVLHVLAQPHAAGVRADRHAELGGHQQHGDHLVDAAQAAAVDLAEVDRTRLEQLLEHDAVLHVLAGRNANRRDCLAYALVSEHVVGAGRLFDPPWVDLAQDLHGGDRLVHSPHLVGVEHETELRPDRGAQQPGAAKV